MVVRLARFFVLAVVATLFSSISIAQLISFPKPELIDYTASNPFDRLPDGRPKVPDNLIERAKGLSSEEVWAVLEAKGYNNQYADGFHVLHPGKTMVGRAFTVQFMPTRPDVADALQAEAERKGLGRLRNQTVIDMLQPGDVIVVDLFGKIDGGTFVGDKLAYYIWKTTGTGMVVDGAMFWLGKIIPTGMPAYYRGTAPDALSNVMLTGINIPIRIGNATVMPGDVVLGDEEGLLFIPPHLVQPALDAAAGTQARDEWIKQKMDTRQYKSSDLYGTPRDPALRKEMEDYIKAHPPAKQN